MIGDGRGVSEQRDALALERLAQFRLGEQAINSEQRHGLVLKEAAQ
jgi:hypothetical protein